MKNKTILSIDCGTQSLRAIIFSASGDIVAKKQLFYSPYNSKQPGFAEQNPNIYLESLYRALKQLKETEKESFDKIEGVGVTTLRNSMVNVDEDGKPLRDIIVWLDQRKAGLIYKPNKFLNLIFKLAGADTLINKTQTDGKCNWIMQNEPHIWEETYKYLQISGFLNYHLTGNFIDSSASQIGYIPFNYKKTRWAKRYELPYKLFPVATSKLPDIVKPGDLIGQITKKASLKTGLKEGLPVIACGSDKGCETIGMGVLNQKMASLSFGTTATVQTTSKKYFEAIKFMPPYPASIPGRYNPEVEIFRGFWMITWFKNEFAHKERMRAKKEGISTEEILNSLLKDVPAGSMGLMVYPYWNPCLKRPLAKGSIIGFGDVHTKAYIYRAVIEGLSYGLLDGLETIEKKGKVRAERLAVSGGASQSDEICQIAADIFNKPIVKGKTFETSALGAALITAKGVGIHSSFKDATHNMVTYKKTFHPNLKNVDIYHELYKNVYKKIYPALKHIYEDIKNIIKYPN